MTETVSEQGPTLRIFKCHPRWLNLLRAITWVAGLPTHSVTSLIAKFMGPTWGPFGATGPRWAPCWPHELCYLGYSADIIIVALKLSHEHGLNRHQTILQTFLDFFLNLTLPGVPYLYKQLPNGQYLSDLCKMCNLDANLWKRWIGDHRILTYIFKWERLNTAGHSHSVSIGHWVAQLHND